MSIQIRGTKSIIKVTVLTGFYGFDKINLFKFAVDLDIDLQLSIKELVRIGDGEREIMDLDLRICQLQHEAHLVHKHI